MVGEYLDSRIKSIPTLNGPLLRRGGLKEGEDTGFLINIFPAWESVFAVKDLIFDGDEELDDEEDLSFTERLQRSILPDGGGTERRAREDIDVVSSIVCFSAVFNNDILGRDIIKALAEAEDMTLYNRKFTQVLIAQKWTIINK